ncbi:hypothetical protein VP1G_01649 [Cytospora mali]|uniref:Uncharacterized protein n=1 Tax=Cytospora mali TaxID=578113 RepID=A0A194URB8_CYTMA|nr:hypothetical protein VP1G_01649 [Valsa mali var. pyri (nom. inval.)]
MSTIRAVFTLNPPQSNIWIIPGLASVYGVGVLITGFYIIRETSSSRQRLFSRFPGTIKNNTPIEAFITAILVLLPALMWPCIVLCVVPFIATNIILDPCMERGLYKGNKPREANDLEMHPAPVQQCAEYGNLRQQIQRISAIREPPPAYSRYPTARQSDLYRMEMLCSCPRA